MLWAMPVQRPYNPNAKRMAELIQADWKAVASTPRSSATSGASTSSARRPASTRRVLLGWTGDNGDPDNFLFALLSCEAVKGENNRARWCNQEFNDLITKAQRSNDLAERTKLYEEAQVVFKREAPWATIAPLGRLPAARQERGRLQDRPVRRPYLLWCRSRGLSGERVRSADQAQHRGEAAPGSGRGVLQERAWHGGRAVDRPGEAGDGAQEISGDRGGAEAGGAAARHAVGLGSRGSDPARRHRPPSAPDRAPGSAGGLRDRRRSARARPAPPGRWRDHTADGCARSGAAPPPTWARMAHPAPALPPSPTPAAPAAAPPGSAPERGCRRRRR